MTPRGLRWLPALVVGAALLWPTPARAEIIERIVAVVNDRIVLLSELNTRVREYLPRLQRIQDPKQQLAQYKLIQRRELTKLVDAILIEGEGKKRKLRVTNAEVSKAIKTVLRQNKLTLQELIATLSQEGYPFASYRADLRKQILRLKTINLAVRSRISISWDEVRSHYRKSVERMGVGLRLNVSQLFLRVDRTHGASSLRRQLARARGFVAQLKKGRATIAQLAKKHSDDAETRGRGGALGFVKRGVLPPQVETAVFAVKGAKKVVGPVVTDSGIYVAYVHARKDSEALPFSKVKRRLKAKLYQLRAAKRTHAWLKVLRSKALIDLRL